MRPRCLLLLALASVASTVRAGDTDDLLAAVRACQGTPVPERPLERWHLGKARTAAAGVVRRNPRAAGGWTDSEVLRAALLYTARGRYELTAGGASGLWFDYARDMVGSVADRSRRRQLQRDWTLAVAALHNSRYDGRSSREVLDGGVRRLPDEPGILFAAGRLHEAIASRAFSGVAVASTPAAAEVVQKDLAEALRLYERVLELQPEQQQAHLRRGRVLSLLGRTRGAREEIEELLSAQIDDELRCLALMFGAVTFEQDGELAEAASWYRRALTTGRSLSAGRLALASVLWRTSDGTDARQTVEELLAGGAPSSDAWWSYQNEGIGDSSDHQARLDALWQEAPEVIASLLLAAALVSQNQPLVFEAASEVVLLDAFVSRGGEPVSGLSAGDFEVVEGGKTCEVELISSAEVPLSAVLVFDTSRSLSGPKLGQLQKASEVLVGGLGPRDQAMLLTFTHALQRLSPLTLDREAIRTALAAVVADGRSAVHDALFAALLLAPRLPGRPVVIVFSDGEDTASWIGPETPLRLARESDALVFAVGAGARSLAELTAVTGGRTIPAEGGDLQAAFGRVLSELRNRYLLRVTPHTTKPGWHEISVRLRRGDAEVRARPGYWRPGKERGKRR